MHIFASMISTGVVFSGMVETQGPGPLTIVIRDITGNEFNCCQYRVVDDEA